MSDYSDLTQANILVIDDEQVNLDVVCELLDSEGYRFVDSYTSPIRAIEQYKSKHYDLVLLDINMPELSGFDVMSALHDIAVPLAPPIIILTALADRATKLRALHEGASDFLTKPFDHEEVISRVKNLVAMHSAQKELLAVNIELEQRIIERTRDLDAAKVEVVTRLAVAADYRDNETSEHTLRVGAISKLLAEKLGYDQGFCDVMAFAAPMHDIGKIGISDTILLKPGRLTDDEMAIMRTHTVIGSDILRNSPSEIIAMGQLIALSHHERWDGKGYPNGLSGHDIPIEGRIVILADVFDALTSPRPYKQPWSYEDAANYIREQKGQFFDPEITDVFLDNLDEIIQIKLAHKD